MQRSKFTFYDWHLSGEMQELMDYINQKFDNQAWKLYGDWDIPQTTKTWSVLVDEYEIATRPVMLAPIADKPVIDTTGFEFYSDRIPKFGHAMTFSESDIVELQELNIPDEMILDKVREKWVGRTSAFIQGFHTELNCMTYEALTTGMINRKPTQYLGVPVHIDFQVPKSHKLKALKQEWFTDWDNWIPNDNADPIADLVRMTKVGDDDVVPYDHFEMDKGLYDHFLMHPKVLSQIQARLAPNTPAGVIYPMSKAEKVQVLMETFEIPVIVPVEEKSMWNIDGKPTKADPSFEPHTVVLVQSGQFFKVKNSPSMYLQDRNPSVQVSAIEGNRIAFLHEYSSEPIGEKTSGELWACPVMRNPKYLITMRVDQKSATGL